MSMFECKPGVIVELREKQNFKQEPFAKHVKIDVHTLRKMERGEPVRRDRVLKVAKALDVSIGELAVEDSDDPTSSVSDSPRITAVTIQQSPEPHRPELVVLTAYGRSGSEIIDLIRDQEVVRWEVIEGTSLTQESIDRLRDVERLVNLVPRIASGTLSDILDAEEQKFALDIVLNDLLEEDDLHLLGVKCDTYTEEMSPEIDSYYIETHPTAFLYIAPSRIDEVRVGTCQEQEPPL